MSNLKFDAYSALIVVDVQNDFLPMGSLATPKGNEILPSLYILIKKAQGNQRIIVATRDWHPINHCSFKQQGGLWPPHCIQNTKGSEFPNSFPTESITHNVLKATNISKDAYSGFEDTDLSKYLLENNIKRVYVCGIATEYCVFATARDAVKQGFETIVLDDLIAEVDPLNKQSSVDPMKELGISFCESTELVFE